MRVYTQRTNGSRTITNARSADSVNKALKPSTSSPRSPAARRLAPTAMPTTQESGASAAGAVQAEREAKRYSTVTWEYSEADTEFGALQAKELKSHLSDVLSQFAVEITEGVDHIEVRPRGVSKEAMCMKIIEEVKNPSFLLCIGSDKSDEEMFLALERLQVRAMALFRAEPNCRRSRVLELPRFVTVTFNTNRAHMCTI